MGRIIEILKFNLIEQRGILLLCSIILISTVVARVVVNSQDQGNIDISQGVVVNPRRDTILRVDKEVVGRIIYSIDYLLDDDVKR